MNVSIKRRQGFTLIELLIVITIIGILAVALVPRISQGPARARDVQRKADLNNIASALELYYSDTGGYPEESTTTTNCLDDDPGADILDYLGGDYPTPPTGASAGQCGGSQYIYSTTTDGYVLGAEMETYATTDGYNCGSSVNWDTFTEVACTDSNNSPVYYVIER